MNFKDTFNKFFIRDGSYDIFWFIFGIEALFAFCLIKMKSAPWILGLGLGVLLSGVFHYITRDQKYFYKEQTFLKREEVLSYTLGKNLFAIFFAVMVLIDAFIIATILKWLGLVGPVSLNLRVLVTYLLFILGTENLILIFSKREEKSYAPGYKRDINKDMKVGGENYKNMIPSILVNILFAVLFYKFNLGIGIFVGILYALICGSIFIMYKKDEIGSRKANL